MGYSLRCSSLNGRCLAFLNYFLYLEIEDDVLYFGHSPGPRRRYGFPMFIYLFLRLCIANILYRVGHRCKS